MNKKKLLLKYKNIKIIVLYSIYKSIYFINLFDIQISRNAKIYYIQYQHQLNIEIIDFTFALAIQISISLTIVEVFQSSI